MTDLVVFPDAVRAVVNYLREALDVTVVSRVPTTRPGEFVTCSRVGGTRRNVVVDDAIVAVECWSTSDETAHDLAQQARAYLHAAAGTFVDDEFVYRVDEVGGPANLPDDVSEQSRYVFTVSVSVRGTAETGI